MVEFALTEIGRHGDRGRKTRKGIEVPQAGQGHRQGGGRHRARARHRPSARAVRKPSASNWRGASRSNTAPETAATPTSHPTSSGSSTPWRLSARAACATSSSRRGCRRRRRRGVRRRIPAGRRDRAAVFLAGRRLHALRLPRADRHRRRRARGVLVLAEQVHDQDDRRLPHPRRIPLAQGRVEGSQLRQAAATSRSRAPPTRSTSGGRTSTASAGAAATRAPRSSPGTNGCASGFSPAIIPTSAAPTRSPSPGCPMSRWNGCAGKRSWSPTA